MRLFSVNVAVAGYVSCLPGEDVVLNFESFADFIDMGGHGIYVWLSYAIALAVVVINIVNPLMQKRQIFTEQARRLRREKQSQ